MLISTWLELLLNRHKIYIKVMFIVFLAILNIQYIIMKITTSCYRGNIHILCTNKQYMLNICTIFGCYE